MTIDVHQHLWPPTLIGALRSRTRPPCLRDWTLTLAGEPPTELAPADHDVDRRREQAFADGLDLALVSLSSPLGIELLPATESQTLIAAYHEGACALPPPFGAWAAACLSEVDPDDLATRLHQGFVGLQLPATALLDLPGYARARPLLAVLEQQRRPLFIHPGPAAQPPAPVPAWWPAVVDYVSQMHAAWFAFRAIGRPRHPRLRVCFAMLAGLAPLHGERFAARAGERSPIDEAVFLDISSYGTRAVDATVRVLGIDALVNGSDRPYARPVAPDLGSAALHALRTTNPLTLLQLKKEVSGVPAVAAVSRP